MMSSVDWPTIDPNSVDGEPDASDLFGGDLFGDELLDMYSATEGMFQGLSQTTFP